MVLGSESSRVIENGNDNSITTISNEILNQTLLLCQEISDKVNERDIVWSTSTNPLTPGLNTSMPTLRTTDQDIIDTSNVLRELVELDEIYIQSIVDNNLNWLDTNYCSCCNDTSLFGTQYNHTFKKTKKPNAGMSNMENVPRAVHVFNTFNYD